MFDGVSLKGWDGNMDLWHVENGTITVESTCEKPTGTVYLIWQGGQPADFELKAELRGEGAGVNSGIQYRSFVQPPRGRRGRARAVADAGTVRRTRRPGTHRAVSQRPAARHTESGCRSEVESGRAAVRFRRHQSL